MNLHGRVEKLEQRHDRGVCPHGIDLRDETERKDTRPPVVCEECGLRRRVLRLVNEGEK
jgi:hypothetical protein